MGKVTAKPKVKAPGKKAQADVVPGVSTQDLKKAQLLQAALPAAEGTRSTKVVESLGLMQAASLALRQRGVTVAFVPTMGALHQGHLALMERARELADVVVASVFVNPTQFGPSEDFDAYPRDKEGDLMKCRGAGVDLLFLPTADQMYPDGFQTSVLPGIITAGACGRHRPGHFAGVDTVVLKLLNLVSPHVLILGEKDWQQLATVTRMVKDLNLPTQVVPFPIMREEDGLAMSSRNQRLSPRDRAQAPVLYRAIQKAQEAYAAGVYDVPTLCKTVMDEIKTVRGVKLQYVEIVDAETIQPLRDVDRPARLLLAAHLGAVRLIDNGPLG